LAENSFRPEEQQIRANENKNTHTPSRRESDLCGTNQFISVCYHVVLMVEVAEVMKEWKVRSLLLFKKKNKSPRKTLCAQNTAHISISLSLSAGTQKYGNNVKNAKLHSRSSSTIQTSKESRLVIAVSLFSSSFFLVAVMCVCVFVFLFFL
jgi:hypothetical protein